MLKKLVTFAIVICVLTAPFSAMACDIWDLGTDSWAYPYLAYMADRDIMPLDGGYSHHNIPTTRGEFVCYIWRAAGCPEVWTAAPSFKDMPVGHEYYEAVEWAVHHNITKGTSANTFSPDLTLTRQEAFTFLYRALPFFEYDAEDQYWNGYIDEFYDREQVSDWAVNPINALCALGIVNGSDGYLVPGRDVANAETAAILFRTLALVGELPYAGMGPYEKDIGFLIYNITPGYIDSISVMPAYTDGDGIEVNLPSGGLDPWLPYYLSFPSDFEYADSPLWVLKISGSMGEYTNTYTTFVPNEAWYVDIYWDSDAEFYGYFVDSFY